MKPARFLGVAVMAAVSANLAFGAVPSGKKITDDTALYQKISEIRVSKELAPDFDRDLERLNALEGRYREELPALSRIKGPMQRIANQKYRYSGKSKAQARRK